MRVQARPAHQPTLKGVCDLDVQPDGKHLTVLALALSSQQGLWAFAAQVWHWVGKRSNTTTTTAALQNNNGRTNVFAASTSALAIACAAVPAVAGSYLISLVWNLRASCVLTSTRVVWLPARSRQPHSQPHAPRCSSCFPEAVNKLLQHHHRVQHVTIIVFCDSSAGGGWLSKREQRTQPNQNSQHPGTADVTYKCELGTTGDVRSLSLSSSGPQGTDSGSSVS